MQESADDAKVCHHTVCKEEAAGNAVMVGGRRVATPAINAVRRGDHARLGAGSSPRRSAHSPRPIASKKPLSSAELEELEIQAKRQEVRQMMERNARRVGRICTAPHSSMVQELAPAAEVAPVAVQDQLTPGVHYSESSKSPRLVRPSSANPRPCSPARASTPTRTRPSTPTRNQPRTSSGVEAPSTARGRGPNYVASSLHSTTSGAQVTCRHAPAPQRASSAQRCPPSARASSPGCQAAVRPRSRMRGQVQQPDKPAVSDVKDQATTLESSLTSTTTSQIEGGKAGGRLAEEVSLSSPAATASAPPTMEGPCTSEDTLTEKAFTRSLAFWLQKDSVSPDMKASNRSPGVITPHAAAVAPVNAPLAPVQLDFDGQGDGAQTSSQATFVCAALAPAQTDLDSQGDGAEVSSQDGESSA